MKKAKRELTLKSNISYLLDKVFFLLLVAADVDRELLL